MARKDSLQPGTKVIALYSFKGSGEVEDLNFQESDVMTIVNKTKDPNWYKARHVDGRVGLVPFNFIKERTTVKLNAMPWFHGTISREEAEILLDSRIDGLFLIRNSCHFPGDYVLDVCFNKSIEHYRVIYKGNTFTVDEEDYYENLSKLVEHYQEDADGLCTKLKQFVVPKEFEFAASVDYQEFVDAGWTINQDNLRLGKEIEKGAFGDIIKGCFLGHENVAVTVLKDEIWKAGSILVGISVMTYLNHKNIIDLVGVAFQHPSIYVVTEYLSKGSLLSYLQSDSIALRFCPKDVKENTQMSFAVDICEGMAYLESHQIVHRNLRAHSIQVSEKNVAKISEFGLARPKALCDRSGPLPIKWTAPEAMRSNGNFSNKSDMWSFGVLLWEIYTLGKLPYPNIKNKDVLECLGNGHRLEKPVECLTEMYDIMLQAWSFEPEKRPNFETLLKQLNLLWRPLA